MTDLRAAAQQALDALEYRDGDGADQWKTDVITTLRAALAQPDEKFCDTHCVWTDHHPDCALAQERSDVQLEPEPVAWMDGYRNIYSPEEKAAGCEEAAIPLYTAPPHSKSLPSTRATMTPDELKASLKRGEKWRVAGPLKEEEIDEIIYSMAGSDRANDRFTFVHAIDFARAIERAHGIGI